MQMFKFIRSKVSKAFSETQQMKIVVMLSQSFWYLRKYFLGVEIDCPTEFLENYQLIKKNSSLDKERNFTLYQLIKMHNKIFQSEETNVIEFGVDRGSSLITLAKFCKKNTNLFGIDSFGLYAKEIRKYSTSKLDSHLFSSTLPFGPARFSDFSLKALYHEITDLNNFSNNKNLFLIKCYFPDIINEKDKNLIFNKKYSFVHLDFDLKKSTLDALKFIFPRLKKNGIILIDDYNFINIEGCKLAVKEFGLDLDLCIQTQSGQLIYFNK